MPEPERRDHPFVRFVDGASGEKSRDPEKFIARHGAATVRPRHARESRAAAAPSVFTLDDPKEIAASLTRSAGRSKARKADPYRSALSMPTFHVNRAGANLSARRMKILNAAKGELKNAFHGD